MDEMTQEEKVARWRQWMGKLALPPRWDEQVLGGAGVLNVPIASTPDQGTVVAVHQAAHNPCGCLSCNNNGSVSQ